MRNVLVGTSPKEEHRTFSESRWSGREGAEGFHEGSRLARDWFVGGSAPKFGVETGTARIVWAAGVAPVASPVVASLLAWQYGAHQRPSDSHRRPSRMTLIDMWIRTIVTIVNPYVNRNIVKLTG